MTANTTRENTFLNGAPSTASRSAHNLEIALLLFMGPKMSINRSERENVPKHPGPQTIQNNIPYLLYPKQAEHPRHPFPHNILNPLLNLSLSLRCLPIPVDTHPHPHGLRIDRRACHHIDFHRVCPLTFFSADEENGRRKDPCVGVESAFGSRLCDA